MLLRLRAAFSDTTAATVVAVAYSEKAKPREDLWGLSRGSNCPMPFASSDEHRLTRSI